MTTVRFSLLFVPFLAWGSAQADRIWPDSKAVARAEYPNTATTVIVFESAAPISAKFEITTKGNGTLELPGLKVGVYDSHNNGLTYRDGLLTCRWRQTSSKEPELEISGVAEFWSEEGNQLIATQAVRALLRYTSARHRFEVITGDPEIYVRELQNRPEN